MRPAGLLWLALLLSGRVHAEDCAAATSQAALNQCSTVEYKQQDRLLNSRYQQVLARASEPQKARLKAAQRAWIAFRDADCTFLSSGARQGSLYPTVYAGCLTEKTRERIRLLNSTLECEEGDSRCPLPAK